MRLECSKFRRVKYKMEEWDKEKIVELVGIRIRTLKTPNSLFCTWPNALISRPNSL